MRFLLPAVSALVLLVGVSFDARAVEKVRVLLLNAPGADEEAQILADLLDPELFKIVKIDSSSRPIDQPTILVKPEFKSHLPQVIRHLSGKPRLARLKPDARMDIVIMLNEGSVGTPNDQPSEKPASQDELAEIEAPHVASREKDAPRTLRFGIGVGAGFLTPSDTVSFTYGSGFLFGGHAGVRIKESLDLRLSINTFSKTVESDEGQKSKATLMPIGLDAVYRIKTPVLRPFLGVSFGIVSASFKPDMITNSETNTTESGLGYGVLAGLAWPAVAGLEINAQVGLTSGTVEANTRHINIGGTHFSLGTAYYF